MKKFITAVLTVLLSVIFAFTFAACGDTEKPDDGKNDNEQTQPGQDETEKNPPEQDEPEKNPPEQEKPGDGDGEGEEGGGEDGAPAEGEEAWKAAFGYFMVDWDDEECVPVESDYPRINFSCNQTMVYTYGDSGFSSDVTVDLDFDSRSFHLYVADEKPDHYYSWYDGEAFYGVGGGWDLDRETDEKNYFYYKESTEENILWQTFDSNIYSYAGGDIIGAGEYSMNLYESYSLFTYSTENNEYTATLFNQSYDSDCDVTVKFEDGKLIYMSLHIDTGDSGITDIVYEYSYGTTVTVPEYFINLENGKTEID